MSAGGGGSIILARVAGGADTPISEHAFRQMLQSIRHSHPTLYASLAVLIGDPVP